MYKLIVIEDNTEIRERLINHFKKSSSIECVFATDSVERLVKYNVNNEVIDLILLDVSLPYLSGIDGLPLIRKKYPNSEIIMYAAVLDDNDNVFQAFSNGATGYLLKNNDLEELEKQLVTSLEIGGSPVSSQITRRLIKYFNPTKKEERRAENQLTETEHKIMVYLKDALTYYEIASNLNISIHGVRYHIVNIYKKLQVKSKQQAINKFNNL